MTRKSVNAADEPAPGLPPTRRHSGNRREASDRIKFWVADREMDGWALNLSRGGVRLILDEVVAPGTKVRVVVGDQSPRDGRVVWVQEEPDGAIVGVEFLDPDGNPLQQSSPNNRASGGVHPPPVKKTPEEP